MQRLLVNADDFGLCDGINRGIVEAHQRGIVASASLMASAYGFDAAVSLARENPGLDVGVHLSLVEEDALTGIALPGSYTELAIALMRGRIRASQLQNEMRAQIQRCLDAGVSACPYRQPSTRPSAASATGGGDRTGTGIQDSTRSCSLRYTLACGNTGQFTVRRQSRIVSTGSLCDRAGYEPPDSPLAIKPEGCLKAAYSQNKSCCACWAPCPKARRS